MKTFQVRVSGKQIEIGASLPEHVQAKLQEILSKYFDRRLDRSYQRPRSCGAGRNASDIGFEKSCRFFQWGGSSRAHRAYVR